MRFIATTAVALGILLPTAAMAQEVTLRAISAFAIDTQFGKVFTNFVEEANKRGKGTIQIRLLGGPETMPPGEVGNAVRGGIVDMAWTPPNFYENLMPEATATALTSISPAEMRANGGWELLDRLHREKANSVFLTSFGYGIKHHLYLTKAITKPDLSGMKVRPAPGMQPFFSAFGAANVATMPGEVYTALERGIIEGYSWPLWGVTDLGWQKVTKFRTEPGYGGVQVNALVNLASWNKLNDAQRKVLSDTAIWYESWGRQHVADTSAVEAKKQADAGIQVITFQGADATKWSQTYFDVMWATLIQRAPENGPRLKALLVK
jgi:TRAP-type C4-dicarboxylate transport system substrate-binding protein